MILRLKALSDRIKVCTTEYIIKKQRMLIHLISLVFYVNSSGVDKSYDKNFSKVLCQLSMLCLTKSRFTLLDRNVAHFLQRI